MKKTAYFAFLSLGLGVLTASAADVDCAKTYSDVKQSVALDKSKVLEVVSSQVAASPSCACEIVKAAIEAASPNPEAVAAIVESAANAAPDQLRLVSQCAVAVAPDSLAQVQALMAKLDPNAGDSSSSAKGAKAVAATQGEVADMGNPLDFPGQGPVGPTPGGPGGLALFPFVPPVLIDFPEVSDPNPPATEPDIVIVPAP